MGLRRRSQNQSGWAANHGSTSVHQKGLWLLYSWCRNAPLALFGAYMLPELPQSRSQRAAKHAHRKITLPLCFPYVITEGIIKISSARIKFKCASTITNLDIDIIIWYLHQATKQKLTTGNIAKLENSKTTKVTNQYAYTHFTIPSDKYETLTNGYLIAQDIAVYLKGRKLLQDKVGR